MSDEEKAIKDLKEDMERCIRLSNYSDAITSDWIGINAIRKQIPQAVIICRVTVDNASCICPNCHKVLTALISEEPKYCIHCGQALDWSEVKE